MLNDHQCGLPTAPKARESNPHNSISDTETPPMATVGPLEDQELAAEGKDLCLQCCPSSKSLTNQREQREDDREHGVGNL